MKTILIAGIFITMFMYVITSFMNHSFDPMTWTSNSVYWFGCLSGIGWMSGCMITVLGLDKENKY